jgi:hypothetical protein
MTRFELTASAALFLLVAGGITVVVKPTFDAERDDTAERDAGRIRSAARSWQRNNSESEGCPTVTQLIHEKHLDHQTRTYDPWGERFRVRCLADDIVVSSAGRDGKLNTGDDVRVPRWRT